MPDRAKLASMFVRNKISWLCTGTRESAAKATLANLRRGIGKPPGSLPELWEITLNGLPETLLARNTEPTQSEHAVYVALTLYALHQQGKDPLKHKMHMEGASLGSALRKLISSDARSESAVTRRFHAVAGSDTIERVAWHLRGLVLLLKNASMPLDYEGLTADLYWFQFPGSRDATRLKWGQDYYRHSLPSPSAGASTGLDTTTKES